MNLLYIGKYPPLEGGTSVAAYWRMKEYAARGICTKIVTACRRDENCLPLDENDEAIVIDSKMDWHIPYTQLFAERLISSALALSEIFKVDVIEGNYFFPYGYAAYIVSLLLDRPLILRHAGSDLFRLGRNGELADLLCKMLQSAKRVVSFEDCRKVWNDMGIAKDNLFFSKRYVPNPKYFHPEEKNGNAVMIGKITDKWDRSQLEYYISELQKQDFHGILDIYSSSKRSGEVKKYFCENGIETSLHEFLSPKNVCRVLAKASYAIVSEIPPNIVEQSNISLEAVACHCSVIQRGKMWRGDENIEQEYENYLLNQFEIYDVDSV